MILNRAALLLVALAITEPRLMSGAGESPKGPAFEFREVAYFARWSQNDQREFTPENQEDLDHWTEMVTINGYPGVDDNEKMAGTANAVLGNYRSHHAKILKARSVPGTKERPTEHFISAMFIQPDFVEVAFARFKLVDKKGISFVYSHRFYGEDKSEKSSAWIKAEADDVEKALMDWDGEIPK
jgi:hypothetical protein